MTSLKIFITILMIVTLSVVAIGFVILATNQKLNQKYGNKLMSVRIALQVAVIILLGLVFALSS